MNTFVLVIMIVSSFVLIGAVLLQPAKGGGSGMLGGSSQSMFGSTGGTTFLFRLTMWCAVIIGSGALFINWHRIREGRSSVIDSVPLTNTAPTTTTTSPTATTPAEGQAPSQSPTEAKTPPTGETNP